MPIELSMSTSLAIPRQENTRSPSSSSINGTPPVLGAGRSEDRQDLSVVAQSLPHQQKIPDEAQLKHAVQEINSFVQNLQRDLQFKVDTESGRTIISVVDSETKEVIRQLPPEDVLARAKRMDEAAKGDLPVDGLLLKTKI